MNPESRAVKKPVLYLYAAIGLAAVFYVPYYFPQSPSNPISWMFGYNNRVGVLILLAVMISGVLWTRGLRLKTPPLVPVQRLPRWWLLAAEVFVISVCCVMYFSAGRYGAYSESKYEIERVWLLSQGKVPYAGFEFAYGPLLLYGPLLVKRLCSLDVAQAYYVFWIVSWLIGTYFLFDVVSESNYPTPEKRSIFVALFITGSMGILCMGTNYTYFRFVCPLFLIAIFQKSLTRNSSGPGLMSAALGAFSTLTLLLISPETAIAFAFAAVLLAALMSLRAKGRTAQFTRWSSICLLIGAMAAEFWIAYRLHVLDTLISDGSGADGFPIFIAPVILLYIGSAFVCLCLLYRRTAEGELTDSTIGFIALSIPMMAAALGRCDPGHIFWNGLGMFLASMFYISNYASAWKRYHSWFLLLLVVIPWMTGIPLSRGASIRSAHKEDMRRSEWTDPLFLDRVYPSWHAGFFAPFGFDPNGRGIVLSPRIDYGHFDAFVNHSTMKSIQETIRELDMDPKRALILPSDFKGHCETNPLGQQVAMSLLFGFPYLGHAVHTESVRKPLCDYILAHYAIVQRPSAQSYSYGLWIRSELSLKAGLLRQSFDKLSGSDRGDLIDKENR